MACKQVGYEFDEQYAILNNWRDKIAEHTIAVNNIIWWFYTYDYVESLVSTFNLVKVSFSSMI